MAKPKRKTKKFGGKIYHFFKTRNTRRDAEYVQEACKADGYNCRITPRAGKFDLWTN